MKKILIIILILSTFVVNATNYYVKNGGNNTNSGLNDAQAWANTSKVNATALVAGDTVFFKRGSVIYADVIMYPNGGSVGLPIVFSTYGTGAKPILSGLRELVGWNVSGNWTNTSGNIWTISYGLSDPIKRLWINGIDTRRSFSPLVTSTNIWYLSGNTLTIFSVGNPAITFTTIQCNLLDKIFYCNYGNITFKNLDLQAAHNCIRIANSADNFIIDGCNIGWNGDGVGILSSNSSTSHSIDNVLIQNCIFASNDSLNYIGVEAQSTFSGIYCKNGASNWEIKNNTFSNWGHSCIDIEASATGTLGYYANNIKIYDNYFTCPNIYYGRGIAIAVAKDYGSGIEIYNNTIFSCPTNNQLSGYGTKFYNNIIDNNNRPNDLLAQA